VWGETSRQEAGDTHFPIIWVLVLRHLPSRDRQHQSHRFCVTGIRHRKSSFAEQIWPACLVSPRSVSGNVLVEHVDFDGSVNLLSGCQRVAVQMHLAREKDEAGRDLIPAAVFESWKKCESKNLFVAIGLRLPGVGSLAVFVHLQVSRSVFEFQHYAALCDKSYVYRRALWLPAGDGDDWSLHRLECSQISHTVHEPDSDDRAFGLGRLCDKCDFQLLEYSGCLTADGHYIF
jgi:hypothetical protein